jgi:mRNA-degrading endonuclease RelE of RelBE toxin-antitoxin system
VRSSFRATPSAAGDLDWCAVREQRLILEAVERYLAADADVETRRRKHLRHSPLAPWELRIGRYPVFYVVLETGLVKLLAVGHKEHNDLFIRGRKVEL